MKKILVVALTLVATLAPTQARSQLVPQPWVSVGVNNSDATFSVGARAINWGVELGKGEDGATGVDVLKFIRVPLVSPYLGLGLYSEDKGVAVSGGVQVRATNNIFVGVGYNTVRGLNGQVGVRF